MSHKTTIIKFRTNKSKNKVSNFLKYDKNKNNATLPLTVYEINKTNFSLNIHNQMLHRWRSWFVTSGAELELVYGWRGVIIYNKIRYTFRTKTQRHFIYRSILIIRPYHTWLRSVIYWVHYYWVLPFSFSMLSVIETVMLAIN